jgi:hypothetical protein
MNKSNSLDSLVDLYFSKNSNSSQKTLVPVKKSSSKKSSSSTLRGSTKSSRSSQKTLVPHKKSSRSSSRKSIEPIRQKTREEEYRELVNEYAEDIMYLKGMKNVLNSTIKDEGSKLTKSQLFNLNKIADEYESKEQQKIEAQKRVIDDLKKIRAETKMTNALNKPSSSNTQDKKTGLSNKQNASALGTLKRAFTRRN